MNCLGATVWVNFKMQRTVDWVHFEVLTIQLLGTQFSTITYANWWCNFGRPRVFVLYQGLFLWFCFGCVQSFFIPVFCSLSILRNSQAKVDWNPSQIPSDGQGDVDTESSFPKKRDRGHGPGLNGGFFDAQWPLKPLNHLEATLQTARAEKSERGKKTPGAARKLDKL